jgi:alpha,alpha-trehalose phosphorylase
MTTPYNELLEVHEQAESFTSHELWDFESCQGHQYPLLLHFPYFDLYRKQVVKQADLVLALYECGHAFTDSEKGRDFEYYERLCVRDSSLSACCQSIVAAEVGHMDLAYDYFAEAALMDLEDLEHNTRDGVHIASLAGTWLVAVAGFGGMRDHFGRLTFNPRLPDALTRLRFRLMYRGRSLLVEVDSEHARYRLRSGEPLTIEHHGTEHEISTEEEIELEIPKLRPRGNPTQPPGRAPTRRRPMPGPVG